MNLFKRASAHKAAIQPAHYYIILRDSMIHDIKLVMDGYSRWSQGTFELARRNWDRNSKEENFQNNPEGICMGKGDT